MKKILEAIRADTQLQALVEAKAGVSGAGAVPVQVRPVPRRRVRPPPQHVLHRAAGHGRLALRLLLLQVLEVLPRLCCGPKPDEAPEGLRRALRHREAAAPSLLAASRDILSCNTPSACAPYAPSFPVLIT